jgi:hypothetical protein
MAIKGVSLAEREEVILTIDPGHPDHADYKQAIAAGRTPEKPTKFFIGNLTKAIRIEIGDMTGGATMRDGGITMDMRNARKAYTLVTYGLKGWDNMTDAEGNPVKYTEATSPNGAGGFTTTVSEESMSYLSADVIRMLGHKILEKNGMAAATVGNSVAPSPLSPEKLSEGGTATNAANSNDPSVDALLLQ